MLLRRERDLEGLDRLVVPIGEADAALPSALLVADLEDEEVLAPLELEVVRRALILLQAPRLVDTRRWTPFR